MVDRLTEQEIMSQNEPGSPDSFSNDGQSEWQRGLPVFEAGQSFRVEVEPLHGIETIPGVGLGQEKIPFDITLTDHVAGILNTVVREVESLDDVPITYEAESDRMDHLGEFVTAAIEAAASDPGRTYTFEEQRALIALINNWAHTAYAQKYGL